MGSLNLVARLRTAFGREQVQEERVVLLKHTKIDENRPSPPEEHVDDTRLTWRRVKNSFKWHSRRKKYSVAKAEELNRSSEGVLADQFRRLEFLPIFDDKLEPQKDTSYDSSVIATPRKGIGCAASPAVEEREPIAGPSTIDAIYCDDDRNHIRLRYKLGPRLGQGGYGVVRRAVRNKDGLKVAVKLVHKTKFTKYMDTAFHPAPLPSEIALGLIVSSNPRCPNIIQLLDWQDNKSSYIIVMEHPVRSMDLSAFLKCNGGVLKEQTAQVIMWQAVYAANLCCYRGVFHRDIKPKNLLVNPETLKVKLIDFGCGELMKSSPYTSFCGTKPFRPPEYSNRGHYHAKPATVYSLGVLMFRMLMGRLPTDFDIEMLSDDISAFNVSQECRNLLWACLQCVPEHRIPLEHMPYDNWFVMNFPVEQSEDAPGTSRQ